MLILIDIKIYNSMKVTKIHWDKELLKDYQLKTMTLQKTAVRMTKKISTRIERNGKRSSIFI